MENFTAAEWFTIQGRPVAAITDPHPAPRSLVGQQVRIDGVVYDVRGVETHCVPDVANLPFALMVETRTKREI